MKARAAAVDVRPIGGHPIASQHAMGCCSLVPRRVPRDSLRGTPVLLKLDCNRQFRGMSKVVAVVFCICGTKSPAAALS